MDSCILLTARPSCWIYISSVLHCLINNQEREWRNEGKDTVRALDRSLCCSAFFISKLTISDSAAAVIILHQMTSDKSHGTESGRSNSPVNVINGCAAVYMTESINRLRDCDCMYCCTELVYNIIAKMTADDELRRRPRVVELKLQRSGIVSSSDGRFRKTFRFYSISTRKSISSLQFYFMSCK